MSKEKSDVVWPSKKMTDLDKFLSVTEKTETWRFYCSVCRTSYSNDRLFWMRVCKTYGADPTKCRVCNAVDLHDKEKKEENELSDKYKDFVKVPGANGETLLFPRERFSCTGPGTAQTPNVFNKKDINHAGFGFVSMRKKDVNTTKEEELGTSGTYGGSFSFGGKHETDKDGKVFCIGGGNTGNPFTFEVKTPNVETDRPDLNAHQLIPPGTTSVVYHFGERPPKPLRIPVTVVPKPTDHSDSDKDVEDIAKELEEELDTPQPFIDY